MKVLHSICQQIWQTQQWSQDWNRSVFIPIPKKGNAKEHSNHCTMLLISHESKVMLKILQVRLQSGSLDSKESLAVWETQVRSLGWEDPLLRRKWQPIPIFLPGKSHGWRHLEGYSPWGHKESHMTEQLHFT